MMKNIFIAFSLFAVGFNTLPVHAKSASERAKIRQKCVDKAADTRNKCERNAINGWVTDKKKVAQCHKDYQEARKNCPSK